MKRRFSSLPLAGDWHSGTYATCAYKCNDECEKTEPNAGAANTFGEIAARAISRRTVLKGAATVGLVATVAGMGIASETEQAVAQAAPGSFSAIPPNTNDTVTVPDGYAWRTFIRWGDPILPGVGGLNHDFSNVTPEQQAGAFGYNCDFVGYLPKTRGGNESNDGLLWVNHEYTDPELMFAGYDKTNPTEKQIKVEMNAHGGSVVEIYRDKDGSMNYRRGAPKNRRITAHTPMTITGPAAGHALMKTNADPTGTKVLGMLNNCAGGKTPWGTILSAEENFDQYFGNGAQAETDPIRKIHERYSVDFGAPSRRHWEKVEDRFDLDKEPNEPFRFGWIVEIDPYDPKSTPIKHTAMGRFKHEGAEMTVAPSGQVVAYMGDDQRFDYMYKYVSKGKYTKGMAVAEASKLLDDGTLYVAKFNDDNTGVWIPLVHGQNGLTAANGFADQAEVLIKARLAGDQVGATPMDRPEDATPDPNRPGYAYVALTNNSKRKEANAANPRVPNTWGHVIEIVEEGKDFAATKFAWDFLLLCGDPEDDSTFYGGYDKSQVSPVSAPDNLAWTPNGSLLIATDGQPKSLKINDSFHFVPLEGPNRGRVQQFCSVPVGAEACGPEFTMDGKTLFLAVQHPGDGGTIEKPISEFPDKGRPARPSMVSIWKKDGGVIG